VPRSELNHSEIMPTFKAKSDANQIESGSIYCKRETGKKISNLLRLLRGVG
jgi:hypothetical protein